MHRIGGGEGWVLLPNGQVRYLQMGLAPSPPSLKAGKVILFHPCPFFFLLFRPIATLPTG